MKTAISIPDPLFAEADELAQRLGISRSEFYVRAIEKYLENYREATITHKLNEIYSEESSAPDPVLTQMQFQAMPKDEGW